MRWWETTLPEDGWQGHWIDALGALRPANTRLVRTVGQAYER
ncbi:hypothetical protein [Streptomyces cadmiisoli]|nr:hypothetical protein [Streptomyces cadmiisoli]